jgi:hypothetical protein
MKRRDFLKRGMVVAGSVALASGLGTSVAAEAETPEARNFPIASTDTVGGFYFPNRAPLQPTMFQKLPIGAIKPGGWLRGQLLLQANGLNGRMPEVSDYLIYKGNGWVTPGSDVGWEEVPYWLRGFGDLGYVLGDQRIITLATQWINGMIDSQQPDGWFGPSNLRTSLDGGPDMWPHMPMLEAARSFHEYNGDPRVLTFMAKYFNFQKNVAATNPGQFNKSWAGVRWGDNLASILWLYNRNGDSTLLDLATVIHNHSANYTTDIPTWHNVNLSQGFREPAEYGMIAKDPKFLAATEHVYDTVMKLYGQFPGGGFAGDENCRTGYHDPRQGFETCGIVELMLSFDILTCLTGDPKWADRREYIAFNTMPAAFDPQQKGTHYITSPNSIQLDDIVKGNDFDDGFAMQVYEPGVHNYRCCPHNYGQGWPYYAETLWLGTSDSGLCAALYAPSDVKAKVGADGAMVGIAQETDYPYGDTVKMTISAAKPVAFPLYLRIPGWCENPTVKVNGRAVAASATPQSFLAVNRTWKNGDVISLHLPMHTKVNTWAANNNAVSVDHGPLTFALMFDEDWKQTGGTAQWPQYEVHPKSAWNYGLVLDQNHPEKSFDVIRKSGAMPENPWTHETNPIELRVKARKIPQWQADRYNVVDLLQPSPARSTEPVETVTLIPMGAARLRISAFPEIGDGPDAHTWVAPAPPYHAPAGTSFVYSHLNGSDSPLAFGDSVTPKSSFDQSIPRFTWWPNQGTSEWVEYDFKTAKTFQSTDVYWFDDTRGGGGCRVPGSWQMVWWDGKAWQPVTHPTGTEVKSGDAFGAEPDMFNHIAFDPITTTKIRIIAQLKQGFSGGLLAWRLA